MKNHDQNVKEERFSQLPWFTQISTTDVHLSQIFSQPLRELYADTLILLYWFCSLYMKTIAIEACDYIIILRYFLSYSGSQPDFLPLWFRWSMAITPSQPHKHQSRFILTLSPPCMGKKNWMLSSLLLFIFRHSSPFQKQYIEKMLNRLPCFEIDLKKCLFPIRKGDGLQIVSKVQL